MGTGNRWEELKLRKPEGKHVSGDLEGLVTGGIGGSFRGSVASLCQTGAQTQRVVPTPRSRPFYILVLVSKGRASLSSTPDFVIQPWGKNFVGARPEIPAFRGP